MGEEGEAYKKMNEDHDKDSDYWPYEDNTSKYTEAIRKQDEEYYLKEYNIDVSREACAGSDGEIKESEEEPIEMFKK